MPRNQDRHLSREEMARFVELGVHRLGAAPLPAADLELADHVAACSVCATVARSQRSVQADLKALMNTAVSERTSECPSEASWLPLAAGVCSKEEALPLLGHASNCDYCGRQLRQTTAALGSDGLEDKREVVRRLASSRPEWQTKLADELSRSLRAGWSAGQGPQPGVSRWSPHLTGRWTLWVPASAAVILIALAIGVWIHSSRPSLPVTGQLVAQAYSEQRTLELRIPGAPYGPLRRQRATESTHFDTPLTLKDAKVEIARELARNPDQAGWLQAKARVDLMEQNPAAAIESLERARTLRPDDLSLKIDLASANFEQVTRPSDYTAALNLLNQVLQADASNRTALFNRAIVNERAGKPTEARADWNSYLRLDPTGDWAEEARQRLTQLDEIPTR